MPDLTGVTNREVLSAMVADAYHGEKAGLVSNFTAQLWAFTNRMQLGDLVVLPLKTTSQIAIGRIIGPYEYRAEGDPERRHLRRVRWERTDVPRIAIRQDLLHSLGAFMTICEISRNDAAMRLEQIATSGIDPGARMSAQLAAASDGETERISAGKVDVEEYATDRLSQIIAERFAGHSLSRLVGAVLTAEGFVCEVSDEGPDGGIDVFAGRGALGLDPPRLVVQVKSSPTPVDAPTVRQLHGVIATHGADQGLMVAWGGVNKVARRELGTQRFNLRVWAAAELIEAICRNYVRLPDWVRAELPLKQIWTAVEDTGPD